MFTELVSGVFAVSDLPTIYVKKMNAIVLSDLHLGFEEEAASLGYFIPRMQIYRSLQVLDSALKKTKASMVIFAGDVKHNFSKLTKWEKEELTRLFSFLKDNDVEVIVVRGNHDNFLPIVTKKMGINLVEEYYEDEILVVHGHKYLKSVPGDVTTIIMGHEHPSIKLRDKLGSIIKMPCFAIAPYQNNKRIVVLPAVGQYQTGTTLSLYPETYLSPILKHEVNLGEIKPYVLAEGLGVLEFPSLAELTDLLAPL